MKVHRSALKHGVAPEDAIQADEWPLWVEPLDGDGPPDRELRLGFDTTTRLLETVVLVVESADEIVIHAMPARRTYLDLLPPWMHRCQQRPTAVNAAVPLRRCG